MVDRIAACRKIGRCVVEVGAVAALHQKISMLARRAVRPPLFKDKSKFFAV